MNITIHNIHLDENYGEELKSFVPFRSFPVRTNSKYELRSFTPAKHPFWPWIDYAIVEMCKISTDKESFTFIIDISLYDVDQFMVNLDEVAITFGEGISISFELPVERYSHIKTDAIY